jgi:DNA mismatch repair protein MutS2
MIFPKSFEEKIGFDVIRSKISNYCITEGGKRLTENMMFDSDFVEVKRKLSETEEIRQAVLFHAPFPFNEFSECFDEIIRISTEGAIIEQHRIKDIKSTIDIYLNCSKYFNVHKEIFPLAYSRDLSDNSCIKDISKKINEILDINGEIKDTASKELKNIRSTIRSEQLNVNKLLGSILKTLKNDGIVKEDSNTVIRNGRCVIPVPAPNQKAVKGFIHDTSSSGQTVFIEPSEIFNINNKISSLYIQEKQEIFNILKDFTYLLQSEIPTLINMCNYLAYLDFIKSKANVAIEIEGTMPNINNKPIIIWYKAKHPLLFLSLKKQNKKIVPLNIQLNNKNRILVISGPNAGGKSIALKTVALIQYMIQTGNLVPLGATSESGIFEDIFIDIGDQQSIENDLSTYTSHLQNMKFFIEHANENSLILIDEIGSGTEPFLGSSIAVVCLEELAKSKAKGVITTHFSSIKKAANNTEGLLNGAMLFNTSEIEPEFILETGSPGSSYTFEIAKRVGFPENLLNKAKTKEVSSQIDYERLMSETLIERKKLEEQKEKLKLADNFLKELNLRKRRCYLICLNSI